MAGKWGRGRQDESEKEPDRAASKQAGGPAIAPIGVDFSKGDTPGLLSTPQRNA
jgi:hypothetical protein